METAVKNVRKPSRASLDVAGLPNGSAADLANRADLEGVMIRPDPGPTLSLTDATLESCWIDQARCEQVSAQGATFREVLWRNAEVVTLGAWRGRWRDVVVDGGRVGVLEAYDATWTSVELRNLKASFANLRGSEVIDLTLSESHLEELDLTEARCTRLAFPGSRIDRLVLHRTEMEDVDLREADIRELVWAESLRGALVSTDQLSGLAPDLARQVGLRVED